MALSNSQLGSVINDKVVLLTGGTGSFGKAFIRFATEHSRPKKLIIFSRDELKQFEMAQVYDEKNYPHIRFFVGDVRDKDRLLRAFDGVDIVIHAAALKQVPTAEYNPAEAIKTNVSGAMNIIDAAIDKGVQKVVALSTDKACNPINLYGATKLCSDKLFIAANSYAGGRPIRFSVVRYGNVVGSRGSVVPFFKKMRATGTIPITDERMTRFFITLEDGVKLVLSALSESVGGEIFVPKIGSMKIVDLARLIAPDCRLENIGIRPGEKLHEMLISPEEGRNTYEFDNHYVIAPEVFNWLELANKKFQVKKTKPGFFYSSDANDRWLSDQDMALMMETTKTD
jgi:UDP-N-acetylglucosamine 4,6-dehydratase/5-epimerase